MPLAASNRAGGSESATLELAAVRFHGQATAISRSMQEQTALAASLIAAPVSPDAAA